MASQPPLRGRRMQEMDGLERSGAPRTGLPFRAAAPNGEEGTPGCARAISGIFRGRTRSIRICPWQKELVDGLLGADLIASTFRHTVPISCKTVDRVLESRIDWDISRQSRGHRTVVSHSPLA